MIENTRLIELLEKYQIDGKKLINNNPNVLEYGEYEEIEKILNYLVNEIGCTSRNIEKCPSILYFTTRDSIKQNYDYLITTELNDDKIKNTLSCLNGNLLDLQYNYEYLIRKVGKEKLNQSLSCVNMKSIELVNICKYFEDKYDKEKLKECISGISGKYSNFDKVKKILDLDVWKEHSELLISTVFKRTAEEIEKILKLDIWEKHSELLTPTVFLKSAEEIEKILDLDVWKEHPELLTPTVFMKSAEEIEKILKSDVWKEHPELLTPTVFMKSAEEIEKILYLDMWKEHPELLTSSVFKRTAEKIMKRYMFITEELDKPEIINRTTMFTMKQEELEAKLNFLEEHGLPLINEKGKVNSIFAMSNKNMQRNYGLTKKELIENYYYDRQEVNSRGSRH